MGKKYCLIVEERGIWLAMSASLVLLLSAPKQFWQKLICVCMCGHLAALFKFLIKIESQTSKLIGSLATNHPEMALEKTMWAKSLIFQLHIFVAAYHYEITSMLPLHKNVANTTLLFVVLSMLPFSSHPIHKVGTWPRRGRVTAAYCSTSPRDSGVPGQRRGIDFRKVENMSFEKKSSFLRDGLWESNC